MSDEIKYTQRIDAFNDDIPYEVRMKYIIEAYKKDLKRLEDLQNYAKGLEEENCLLTKKIDDMKAVFMDRQEYETTIKKMQTEINQLKGQLTKVFPKRVVKVHDLKKRLRSMNRYIFELQTLLINNDIPFEQQKVTPNSSDDFDIEKLDIFAVRGKNENFEITEE